MRVAIRVKLKEFLEQNSISAYRLAETVEDTKNQNIYRIARGGKPSLGTLEDIIRALRKLTGKEVQVSDLLEFSPD